MLLKISKILEGCVKGKVYEGTRIAQQRSVINPYSLDLDSSPGQSKPFKTSRLRKDPLWCNYTYKKIHLFSNIDIL